MQAEAATATPDRTAVLAALQRASQATGTDFNYLLGTAMRESGLKPAAKAATSSATGLFQFVDQTWLGTLKTYGAKHGLNAYASAITQGSDGRYRVTDPTQRSAILALRKDPQVSALMEGEYAQASRATLQSALGRDVCGGELYAAHFLGDSAACRLIRMSDSHPDASAPHAFPAAADANWKVFHHADGTPKTVREVYNWALKQTGSNATAAAAPMDSATNVTIAGSAPDLTDATGILAGLTSWRPRHGFFSNEAASDGSTPSTPFLMTPAVMDVLSSLDPVAPGASTN